MTRHSSIPFLVLLLFHRAFSLSLPSLPNRRILLKTIGAPLIVSSCPSVCQAAPRVKGAAEYDLEFYLRDLVKGNNKEGNIEASVAPKSLPSRRLDGFVQNIINNDLNEECIAIRTLSSLTNTPVINLSNDIKAIRDKVSKAFYSKAPWREETMLDEYYFDLTGYSLYRVASQLIPSDYKLRDVWVKTMGVEIYKDMKNGNVVSREMMNVNKLTDSIPLIKAVLDYFKSIHFIESYELGDKKNDDYRVGESIFDSYDNEDIDSGLTVDCLVSIKRPVTLGSALQITGEGSRFSPDFISPTLSAIWKTELGLNVVYESYFVDSEYRPNPKDFFPDEQLLQFSIKR